MLPLESCLARLAMGHHFTKPIRCTWYCLLFLFFFFFFRAGHSQLAFGLTFSSFRRTVFPCSYIYCFLAFGLRDHLYIFRLPPLYCAFLQFALVLETSLSLSHFRISYPPLERLRSYILLVAFPCEYFFGEVGLVSDELAGHSKICSLLFSVICSMPPAFVF